MDYIVCGRMEVNMRVNPEETMALVIDFQERLLPVIDNNEELLHNTEILVKGLRVLNIPILVTQQYTKGIGMTVPSLISAIGEEFTYYDKLAFSCAEDETIYDRIIASGKRNIIVCGIETHICVLQTVIDLKARGFQVVLVEDCVGSRRERDRQAGIQRAMVEGALPATYESILFELTKKAGNDVFKQISKLIK